MFLVFGASGFLGSRFVRVLEDQQRRFAIAKSRLENQNNVENEIKLSNAKFVFVAAGLKGKPNVVRELLIAQLFI